MKWFGAIALSTLMTVAVILPTAALADSPVKEGAGAIAVSATEAGLDPADASSNPESGPSQQAQENNDSDGADAPVPGGENAGALPEDGAGVSDGDGAGDETSDTAKEDETASPPVGDDESNASADTGKQSDPGDSESAKPKQGEDTAKSKDVPSDQAEDMAAPPEAGNVNALGGVLLMSGEGQMSVDIGGVSYPEIEPPELSELELDLLTPQTVTVDLSGLADVTGKQLKITVPEGLAIDGYPGIGGTDLPPIMVGSVTLSKEPAKDVSYTITANFQARNGELVYDLADGYQSGQFVFKIGADRARFYQPHTVPNPLKIELMSGETTLSGREITTKLKTTLNYVSNTGGSWLTDRYFFRAWSTLGSVTNKTSFAPIGSEAPIMPCSTSMVQAGSEIRVTGKKQALTLAYPAQAELLGVQLSTDKAKQPNGVIPEGATAYGGDGTNGNTSIVHDAAAQTVTFYYEGRLIGGTTTSISDGVALRLKFNSGAGSTYGIPSTIDFTAYDGNTITTRMTSHYYQVIDSSSDTGRLSIVTPSGIYKNTQATDIPGLTGLTVVGFVNKNTTEITNQTVRYTFPKELRVRGFDAPSQQTGSRPYTIKFKLHDDDKEYSVTKNLTLTKDNRTGDGNVRVTAATLGIAGDTNAILEWASINVGKFDIGYKGYPNALDVQRGECIFGSPAPGTSGNFTIGVNVTSDTIGTDYSSSTTVTVQSEAKYYAEFSSTITQKPGGGYSYTSGDEIAVRAQIGNSNIFMAGALQKTRDPNFYIVLPKDVSLKAGSVKVTGASTKIKAISGPASFDASGRTLIVVSVDGIVGSYKDDLTTYGTCSLEFVMIPSDSIKTVTLNMYDLVLFGTTDGSTPNRGEPSLQVKDEFDFNNDGSKTDILQKYGTTSLFTIASEPNFNIFAEIGLPGDGDHYTYDDENAAKTTVPFTTVSTAEYVLHIVNNTSVEAGNFVSYVPVPKKGLNYGTHFQSGAFKWSMGLAGEPGDLPSGYKLSYTVDDFTGSTHDSADYVPAEELENSPSDWADVTMIKIESTANIPAETEHTIKFIYTIEETPEAAISGSGDVNVFRPYYYINAEPFITTWKTGAPVAASLSTGEVEGRVFVDTNGNGYVDQAEMGLADVTVRLRLPAAPDVGYDYSTGATAGYTAGSDGDGNYVQTKTAADGSYGFPGVPAGIFGVQVLNPDGDLYQFTAQNVTLEGQPVQNDSDVDPATGVVSGINSTVISNSGNIYAGLKYRAYTVNYDSAGGTEVEARTDVRYNGANLIPTTPVKKTGYALTRWDVTSGGNAAGVAQTATYGALATDNKPASITLTAWWTPKKYTIVYDNGYSESDSLIKTESDKTIVADANTVAPPLDPTRTGYTFGGWSKTKGGAAVLGYRNSFTLTGATINDLFSSDSTTNTTLYGVWTAKSYTVDYDDGYNASNSTIKTEAGKNISGTVAPPADPTRTGYTFGGWSMTKGGAAFAACRNNFTLNAPLINILFTNDMTTNTTLYAVWTANTYTVRYYSNQPAGSTGTATGAMGSLEAVYGQDLTLTANGYTLAGYSFSGWNTLANGSGADNYMNSHTFSPWELTSDLDLYAKWTPNIYILGFDANGGSAGTVSMPVIYDATVGALPTAGSGAPTRGHYTFQGWATTNNAATPNFTVMTRWTKASNDTVYAVWKENAKYTVTYNANGGSGAPSDSKAYYAGETATVKPADGLARDGYTFQGWAETGAGAAKYNAGSTFLITGNTTLYAVWQQNEQPEQPEQPVTPVTPVTPPTPPAGPTPGPGTVTPTAPGYPGPESTTTVTNDAGPAGRASNLVVAENPTAGNYRNGAASSPLALLSRDGEVVSQEELRELARDAGIPLVGTGDNAIPLVGIEGYAFWSLVDLAIVLFGVVIALCNVLAYRRRRYQNELDGIYETGANFRPLFILILAIALANAVLFMLTQDFAATPLVMVDVWTIPAAALLIAEFVLGRAVGKRAKSMKAVSEEVVSPVDAWNV
jgi:uncharacterized repeat protein (TIGR02543 family)